MRTGPTGDSSWAHGIVESYNSSGDQLDSSVGKALKSDSPLTSLGKLQGLAVPVAPRQTFRYLDLPIELQQKIIQFTDLPTAVTMKRVSKQAAENVERDPYTRSAIALEHSAFMNAFMTDMDLAQMPEAQHRFSSLVCSSNTLQVAFMIRDATEKLVNGGPPEFAYNPGTSPFVAGLLIANTRATPVEVSEIAKAIDSPPHRPFGFRRSQASWERHERSCLMSSTLEAMAAGGAPVQAYAPLHAKLGLPEERRRLRDRLNPFAVESRYEPLKMGRDSWQHMPAPIQKDFAQHVTRSTKKKPRVRKTTDPSKPPTAA